MSASFELRDVTGRRTPARRDQQGEASRCGDRGHETSCPR